MKYEDKNGWQKERAVPGAQKSKIWLSPLPKGGGGERQKSSFAEGDEGIKREPARGKGRGGRNVY